MATLDISRLTPKERLDLIGELWDSLSATDVRLTPAQEAELDRRLATFDADRVVFVFVRNDAKDGAENFFSRDGHVVADVGEDGGLDVKTSGETVGAARAADGMPAATGM